MKRLSLLKKITLGSGALASVTPIALMTTSCGVSSFQADFVDFRAVADNANYSKATTSGTPFRKILYGSKKIYSGNYVVFVGSNMFKESRMFFAGTNEGYLARAQWFNTESTKTPDGRFDKSHFWIGIKDAKDTPNLNNFGIYNCIDFWDQCVYDKKGHQIYISEKTGVLKDTIGPWDVWTDVMIQQTKEFNKSEIMGEYKYDWDETSVKKDEYIRNDSSAQQFRALCKEGLMIYPTTDKRKTSFNTANNNTDSKMIIFKDGKLVDIAAIPSTSDAWKDIIVKNFKPEEK